MKKLLISVLLIFLAMFSPEEAGPSNYYKPNTFNKEKIEECKKKYLEHKFKNELNETLKKEMGNKSARKKLYNKYTNADVVGKIIQISEKFSIKPTWLIRIILKESRGNPEAINRYSGATGIIQWMPKTAKYLGTSVNELQKMSIFEQLHFVEKYIDKVTNKYYINTYEDLYLAVFYPKALGKKDNYIIGNNDKLVAQNKVVDYNNDNVITVRDFKSYALN